MKHIVDGELFRTVRSHEPMAHMDELDTGSEKAGKIIKHYRKKECKV